MDHLIFFNKMQIFKKNEKKRKKHKKYRKMNLKFGYRYRSSSYDKYKQLELHVSIVA